MNFADDYIRRHNDFIAPSTIDPKLRIVIDHGTGQGIVVKDTSGKRYMVFDSEVAVNALGWRHPKMTEFRQKYPQIFDFCETSGRYLVMRDIQLSWKNYPELSPAYLAERLIKKTFPTKPTDDYMVIMKETGALAVNSAIKACLKINPSRRHFIAFDGAFHGRVEFSRALSRSKSIHQKDYPETGIHVHHFPYPQITQDINFINESLNRIPVENINAVITEVIQGEGGMQFANPHLLKDLLLNFQNKDILAGIDDIQAGNGRTGFWSSWEWLNYMTPNSPEFVPDFVIQGKALGGGLPIGAVIFPKNDLPNGWEGGTFPWFPASVAQAIIFLDIVEEEKLVEKVRENGEYLADKLKSVNEYVLEMVGEAVPRPYNLIQKGIGFMQGLEFRKEWREPDARLRNKVLANLAENGVLTQGAGNDNINPTIRFTPPYITTNKDIDEMAEALKKSIIQALN